MGSWNEATASRVVRVMVLWVPVGRTLGGTIDVDESSL
jgi:hypothetical protein